MSEVERFSHVSVKCTGFGFLPGGLAKAVEIIDLRDYFWPNAASPRMCI